MRVVRSEQRTRRKPTRTLVPAAVLSAVVLVLAGCGGAAGDSPSGPVEIGTKTLPGLGRVLVNQEGMTLYTFVPDHQKKVTCTKTCAANWPPLVVKHASQVKAGSKVKESLIGTVTNPNPVGGKVVTYHGWPLYLYTGDAKPGQATGQGLNLDGGFWYVIRPSGQVVKKNGEPG